MIHWDREARRRRLSARLKALDEKRLVAFVATTLEQAMKLAAPARHPARTLLRDTIALARKPTSTVNAIAALSARIEAAQPDEDDSPPPGCADLLDGAGTLCSLLRRPKPATASGAASYAYQAVLHRFLDRRAAAGGEAEFERAEKAIGQAMTFLEAQYALLDELEAGPSAAAFAVWEQDRVVSEIDEPETLRRVAALGNVETTAVDVALWRGDVVTLLLTPQRAFLLHMDRPGEVGRVACGPAGKAKEWRFRLGNGQVDVYPDSMTLPRASAIALLHAAVTGGKTPRAIRWST